MEGWSGIPEKGDKFSSPESRPGLRPTHPATQGASVTLYLGKKAARAWC